MFYRIFIAAMVLMIGTGTSFAGLDRDGVFDNTIAIYRFENPRDSGPRRLHGESASIVEQGKIGKCLILTHKDWFGANQVVPVFLVSDLSIVSWVKLKKQRKIIIFEVTAHDKENNSIGHFRIDIIPSGRIQGWHISTETAETPENVVHLRAGKPIITDDKWHHIAFTTYGGIYTLYVDGNIAARSRAREDLIAIGSKTSVGVYAAPDAGRILGDVLIDELGFFEIGFSVYEIREIYKNGFRNFLRAMPVDLQGKIATTWGDLKIR